MEQMNRIKYLVHNFWRLLKSCYNTKVVDWSYLTGGIKENCYIHPMTKIGFRCFLENVKIDKGTYISSNARISLTEIGKFCSIGPNFISGWGIHPIHGISTSPVFYSTLKQAGFTYSPDNKVSERSVIKIGSDVFIGANVTVLDGVTIGDGAVIGAGAIVSKDIPAYAVAVGSPIRIIRYRFSQDVIKQMLALKWWNCDVDILRQVEQHFFDVESFLIAMNSKKINRK